MEFADKKNSFKKFLRRSNSEIVYKIKRREDELSELERLYESLNLEHDDELLDRAERRDLPIQFQINWSKYDSRSQVNGDQGVFDQIANDKYDCFNKRRSVGTMEALITLRSHSPSPRTPPYRRSAIPDIVNDDYAFRKYLQYTRTLRPTRSDSNVNGSYLLMSSAYTPTLKVDEVFKDANVPNPDIEQDDLSYRKLKQADAANVLPPHPPFGIPNCIVGHSSPTDYLHSDPAPKKSVKLGFKHQSEFPDLVHDDMAFRNLRKDVMTTNNNNNIRNLVPKLYSQKKNSFITFQV